MKRTIKWIIGLGMLAFCLQMKPCPHGNCPAGSCLEEGPRPMGWQLVLDEKQPEMLPDDSLAPFFADSLSHSPQYQK